MSELIVTYSNAHMTAMLKQFMHVSCHAWQNI